MMYQVKTRLHETHLKELTVGKNTYVHCKHINRHITVEPCGLSDVKAAIRKTLDAGINKYDQTLDGLFLGYSNIKLVENKGLVFYEDSFIHLEIAADFYVFTPKLGCTLAGVVTKVGENHIGCLVHKVFNASVVNTTEQKDWPGFSVQAGQEIEFEVIVLEMNRPLPYIRGKFSEIPFSITSDHENNDKQAEEKERKKERKRKLKLQVNIVDYSDEPKKKKKKIISEMSEVQSEVHLRDVDDVPALDDSANRVCEMSPSSVRMKRKKSEDGTDAFKHLLKQKKKKHKAEVATFPEISMLSREIRHDSFANNRTISGKLPQELEELDSPGSEAVRNVSMTSIMKKHKKKIEEPGTLLQQNAANSDSRENKIVVHKNRKSVEKMDSSTVTRVSQLSLSPKEKKSEKLVFDISRSKEKSNSGVEYNFEGGCISFTSSPPKTSKMKRGKQKLDVSSVTSLSEKKFNMNFEENFTQVNAVFPPEVKNKKKELPTVMPNEEPVSVSTVNGEYSFEQGYCEPLPSLCKKKKKKKEKREKEKMESDVSSVLQNLYVGHTPSILLPAKHRKKKERNVTTNIVLQGATNTQLKNSSEDFNSASEGPPTKIKKRKKKITEENIEGALISRAGSMTSKAKSDQDAEKKGHDSDVSSELQNPNLPESAQQVKNTDVGHSLSVLLPAKNKNNIVANAVLEGAENVQLENNFEDYSSSHAKKKKSKKKTADENIETTNASLHSNARSMITKAESDEGTVKERYDSDVSNVLQNTNFPEGKSPMKNIDKDHVPFLLSPTKDKKKKISIVANTMLEEAENTQLETSFEDFNSSSRTKKKKSKKKTADENIETTGAALLSRAKRLIGKAGSDEDEEKVELSFDISNVLRNPSLSDSKNPVEINTDVDHTPSILPAKTKKKKENCIVANTMLGRAANAQTENSFEDFSSVSEVSSTKKKKSKQETPEDNVEAALLSRARSVITKAASEEDTEKKRHDSDVYSALQNPNIPESAQVKNTDVGHSLSVLLPAKDKKKKNNIVANAMMEGTENVQSETSFEDFSSPSHTKKKKSKRKTAEEDIEAALISHARSIINKAESDKGTEEKRHDSDAPNVLQNANLPEGKSPVKNIDKDHVPAQFSPAKDKKKKNNIVANAMLEEAANTQLETSFEAFSSPSHTKKKKSKRKTAEENIEAALISHARSMINKAESDEGTEEKRHDSDVPNVLQNANLPEGKSPVKNADKDHVPSLLSSPAKDKKKKKNGVENFISASQVTPTKKKKSKKKTAEEDIEGIGAALLSRAKSEIANTIPPSSLELPSFNTCSLGLSPEPLEQLIKAEQEASDVEKLAPICTTPEYFRSDSMVNAEDRRNRKSSRRSLLSLNKPTAPLPAAAQLHCENRSVDGRSPRKDARATRGRGIEGLTGFLTSDDDSTVSESVAASKVGALKSADELKEITSRLLGLIPSLVETSSKNNEKGKVASSEDGGSQVEIPESHNSKLPQVVTPSAESNKVNLRQAGLGSSKRERNSVKSKAKNKESGSKEHKKHKKKHNSKRASNPESDTGDVDKMREELLKSCLTRFTVE